MKLKAITYGHVIDILFIQKTVTELQTSLTFAHEVSHNLGAAHDLDNYGKEISGTLMGATLGKNVTISNLKISNKSKQDIENFFTRVINGIRYELVETMNNDTHFYINQWPKEDQDRVKQGYMEKNCFKDKLGYSNEDRHFLKLRKDLENQVNPKIPTTVQPGSKPTPEPKPEPTPEPTLDPTHGYVYPDDYEYPDYDLSM